MVFSEVIKLKDGIFNNLNYHQKRVDNTLKSFKQPPIDLSIIKNMIPEYAHNGIYKCKILYSNAIEKIDFMPYTFRKIDTLEIIIDNNIDYSYKYADRSYIDKLVKKSSCDDIIIIKNGYVTDSSCSNLVFRLKDELVTPKHYLLPGTKRQSLIDNGKIKTKKINLEDIFKYDSVYFINAMIDLEDNVGCSITNIHVI